MRSSLYLLALAATFSLPACAQRGGTRQPPRTAKQLTTQAAQAAGATDTALVFQRTPCHGTCPTYTATVFRNGRVAYNGERFVPVMGMRTASLPAPTVNAMLAEAKRIKFNDLNAQYSGNATDLPGVVIVVYQPGQRPHRVVADQDMPDNLKGYITYLRSKLDPLAGIGAE